MDEYALSLRQPWATLVVAGLKSVEIRTWTTDYRGLLYIHAARTVDSAGIKRFRMGTYPLGALIGTVELTKIDEFTDTMWSHLVDLHLDIGPFAPGYYAWHLSSPRMFSEPIPCRGSLRLFSVDLGKISAELESESPLLF